MINIFTDGSCDKNKKGIENKGAHAFVAINENGVKFMEKVRQEKNTTNNRMELSAVINALESFKNSSEEITIFTDSEYVSNAINKGWLEKWKRNNYIRNKKKKTELIPNKDLWQKLDSLLKTTIKIKWVKGHSSNVWNNYVDKLCTESYNSYTVKSLAN